MIEAWAPFRISFVGGGSDLPAFCDHHPGAVISATLAAGVTARVVARPEGGVRIEADGAVQEVRALSAVDNPLLREALRLAEVPERPDSAEGLWLSTRSDVSGGNGLGGSSACGAAVLAALSAHRGRALLGEPLARAVCELELCRLAAPVGRQDQYATALGGLNELRFGPRGHVAWSRVEVPRAAWARLRAGLWLVDTGRRRRAGDVLEGQRRRLADGGAIIAGTRALVALVAPCREALVAGDLAAVGELLHESWQIKRTLSPGITDPEIDALYDRARQAGMIGGKLLGAGGGGFLLLVGAPSPAVERAVQRPLIPVRLLHRGACILSEEG